MAGTQVYFAASKVAEALAPKLCIPDTSRVETIIALTNLFVAFAQVVIDEAKSGHSAQSSK